VSALNAKERVGREEGEGDLAVLASDTVVSDDDSPVDLESKDLPGWRLWRFFVCDLDFFISII
jgi:hypothetical protein